jgi:hypothetical protein
MHVYDFNQYNVVCDMAWRSCKAVTRSGAPNKVVTKTSIWIVSHNATRYSLDIDHDKYLVIM